jgi:ketosteroid isomerase-like protein
MSQETIIRKPLSATHSASRTLEERLMLRFPRLFAAVGRLTRRLPAKSRLRQTLIWRSVNLGFGAVNRRDFDAVVPRYHPDVEIHVSPAILGLGDIEPVYRGREGYRQFYRDWLPAWGGGFQFKPQELIDLGDDRLVALVKADFRGQGSGVGLEGSVSFLWTLDQEGRVIREENFLNWEALEAAGLAEQDAHADP